MRRQEKFGAVHFILIGLTVAFIAALAGLAARDGTAGDTYHAGAEDAYRVAAERGVPAEPAGAEAYGLLDINTAAVEELQELTGIGPVLAQAIVDYRAEYGPFRSVDELLKVSGIGEARLGEIRGEVTVSGG